jgi:type IV secretory pathway TraG/TraD family ATPase VirD4
MFSHRRNALNLYEAMNSGSLILINTAKDLLKAEGCEIMGRFFIALISQATQERAAIAPEKRMPTWVYIDEAQDYFDTSIEELLTQGRKYKTGMIISHQNLDQLEPKLRHTVIGNTSIKLLGGLSSKDAGAFAAELQCDPAMIMSVKKTKQMTEFVCIIGNGSPRRRLSNRP